MSKSLSFRALPLARLPKRYARRTSGISATVSARRRSAESVLEALT